VAIAEEAIRPFRAAGDDLGLARAWRLIAQARYLARRAGECVEASELALTHARRAGDRFEIKEIVEWLVVALALGPTPAAEASRRCAELLEVIAGERFLEVTLPAVRAYLEAIQGRKALADELLESARRMGGDSRYLRRVAYFGVYAGLMLAGDPAAAERELRAGADALREVGELTNYCSVTSQLALALCDQGRYDEAEHYTRESEAAARANDVMANVLWRAGRARVLAARGELASAEALADEAIAFADPSDFVVIHALACQAQAEVLRRAGRHTEARAAVDRAVALFEQKGDAVSAARAPSVLGQ
jgi:ATP/maltotriose-dependent transcriptional regulator MalT